MTQYYATDAARIGKLKGEILKRAIPREVLGIAGQNKQIPQNNSDTVVYKRYLPYGGVDNRWIADGGDATFVTAHLTVEGVTPSPDSITSTSITAVLAEYAALYAYTNKTAEMHEDDFPAEETAQVGDRLGLVREMVRFGIIKAGTNKQYGGTGTSRATVNGAVSAQVLRRVKRSLEVNHGEIVTDILSPSPNFGTSAIEPAFLAFCHSDCESDIRDLPKFTPCSEYGSRKKVHAREIGSWENFRFVTSPELTFYVEGGATASGTGMKTSGTDIDVYPMIITGMNAWGSCALRGLDSITPSHVPHGKADSADPLGQRGYIGARTYFDTTILNDGWMAVAEVGVSDLA